MYRLEDMTGYTEEQVRLLIRRALDSGDGPCMDALIQFCQITAFAHPEYMEDAPSRIYSDMRRRRKELDDAINALVESVT